MLWVLWVLWVLWLDSRERREGGFPFLHSPHADRARLFTGSLPALPPSSPPASPPVHAAPPPTLSRMDRAKAKERVEQPIEPVAGPDTEWVVDGYNVIQVILLGGEDRSAWWRGPARQRLFERASRLPTTQGRAWLVFDGPDPVPESDDARDGPHIVFAPSADDWIVRRVKQRGAATPIVVTADRRLAGRCRHAGARVVTPSDFVAYCRDEEPSAAE